MKAYALMIMLTMPNGQNVEWDGDVIIADKTSCQYAAAFIASGIKKVMPGVTTLHKCRKVIINRVKPEHSA
jgi:hypothetical protein